MAEPLRPTDDTTDPDYALDKDFVSEVLTAVGAGNATRVEALLEPLHAADVADLLEQINTGQRKSLLSLWSREVDGELLSELDESLREEVIDELPQDILTEAVRDLESDDVVDLIEDLEQTQQDAILEVLEGPDRVAVEQALQYPEYSAGRLMQRELVMAPEHWTVGEAIDHIRTATDLPAQFYHLILIDPRMRPTGYVTLGRLLSTPRARKLSEITEESFQTIPVTQDEGEVAYAFNQYHLISAPVVDEEDRLVGVITIDDAMAVLDEEHEEDILRLAGVGETSMSDTILQTTRQRLPWLCVNLFTAILASLVIAQFQDVLAQIVVLAVLMPIVASMGGNAGTQSLTVTVRALATKDLTSSNALRILGREVGASLINGCFFAVVMGALAALWSGDAQIGMVIGTAMIITLGVAGFAGLMVPVALEKIGVDPALASGTFVTTVTDVVGFLTFLGFAGWFLL